MQNASKHTVKFAQVWQKQLFSEVKKNPHNTATHEVYVGTALVYATDLAYPDRMGGAFQQQLSQSQLSCPATPPIIQVYFLACLTNPLHM